MAGLQAGGCLAGIVAAGIGYEHAGGRALFQGMALFMAGVLAAYTVLVRRCGGVDAALAPTAANTAASTVLKTAATVAPSFNSTGICEKLLAGSEGKLTDADDST
jgi:hypothetical protein